MSVRPPGAIAQDPPSPGPAPDGTARALQDVLRDLFALRTDLWTELRELRDARAVLATTVLEVAELAEALRRANHDRAQDEWEGRPWPPA